MDSWCGGPDQSSLYAILALAQGSRWYGLAQPSLDCSCPAAKHVGGCCSFVQLTPSSGSWAYQQELRLSRGAPLPDPFPTLDVVCIGRCCGPAVYNPPLVLVFTGGHCGLTWPAPNPSYYWQELQPSPVWAAPSPSCHVNQWMLQSCPGQQTLSPEAHACWLVLQLSLAWPSLSLGTRQSVNITCCACLSLVSSAALPVYNPNTSVNWWCCGLAQPTPSSTSRISTTLSLSSVLAWINSISSTENVTGYTDLNSKSHQLSLFNILYLRRFFFFFFWKVSAYLRLRCKWFLLKRIHFMPRVLGCFLIVDVCISRSPKGTMSRIWFGFVASFGNLSLYFCDPLSGLGLLILAHGSWI